MSGNQRGTNIIYPTIYNINALLNKQPGLVENQVGITHPHEDFVYESLEPLYGCLGQTINYKGKLTFLG
jgi:hypothetical protein